MTEQPAHSVDGRWRIVEADIWDREYLDLVEPAHIIFTPSGGEFAFGAVTGTMDGGHGKRTTFFTWEGSDEMDLVSGAGEAQLEKDGTLTIDLRFHYGAEAQLKAIKT